MAAITVAGIVLVSTIAAPATASAATCMVSSTASASQVVVGVSVVKTKSITAKLTNCPKSDVVEWAIGQPVAGAQFVTLKRNASGAYTGTARFVPSKLNGPASKAGDLDSEVRVTNPRTGEILIRWDGPVVHLRRAARFTSMVSGHEVYAYGGDEVHHSTNVAKGSTIHVQSFLERASWGRHPAYVGFTKQSVTLQFRTTKGSYRSIKTIKTLDASDYPEAWVDVKATVDGCFRYVWKGSGTTAARTTAGACINVI